MLQSELCTTNNLKYLRGLEQSARPAGHAKHGVRGRSARCRAEQTTPTPGPTALMAVGGRIKSSPGHHNTKVKSQQDLNRVRDPRDMRSMACGADRHDAEPIIQALTSRV